MPANLDEQAIRSVVEQVMKQIGQTNGAPTRNDARPAQPVPGPGNPHPTPGAPAGISADVSQPAGCCCHDSHGVYAEAEKAIEGAQAAYELLCRKGVEARKQVVAIIKRLAEENAGAWGRIELEETKIGRLDHKVEKLQIVKLVPGVEWLRPDARSGDHGITLEEYTPFGVIGAITPSTHSVPTLSGNIVNAVAAGNSLVFNPHPGAARCAAVAVRAYNQAIEREVGIRNLVTTIEKPTLESFDAICKDERVRLLCITGGPAVVQAALKSGKRAICAGPGNPPVVIDETADLDKAARDIIQGAGYDNNLLCIGEKEVFVVAEVADAFIAALNKHGAAQLNSSQLAALTEAAFTYKEGEGVGCGHPVLKRDLVGKDASVLAKACGASVPADCPLLFAETDADHAFVVEEQMMPMLPVVRVPDFKTAVAEAKKAEHGYKHSAMIHSRNVEAMTYMARELEPTLFVKNGPCVAGLGLGGEGYLSYSVATTTGEGITTPQTFTRTRRCVMVDNLKIY
ncbi:MAG: aldehyde dehydrogenase family protein [Opitutales bacterium]